MVVPTEAADMGCLKVNHDIIYEGFCFNKKEGFYAKILKNWCICFYCNYELC